MAAVVNRERETIDDSSVPALAVEQLYLHTIKERVRPPSGLERRSHRVVLRYVSNAHVESGTLHLSP